MLAMRKHEGWIGVDLDGTLAEYDTWRGVEHIGAPIPAMVERVKQWIAEGREVRIFTARAFHFTHEEPQPLGGWPHLVSKPITEAHANIREWCRQHLGTELGITNVKDFGMLELWDDRAVQVKPNTGEAYGPSRFDK